MKTLHKVMICNQSIKDNADMRRIFKSEIERRMRELLQDRDSSEMYGVYLHKNEPRKSYINFLRPESATFIFDYLFTQLLEVKPTPEIMEMPNNTDNTVDMISKNSVDPSQDRSQNPPLSETKEDINRNRFRGNRKLNKVESYINQSKLSQDKGVDSSLGDDNDMGNMIQKITPNTGNRKSKIDRLLDDNNTSFEKNMRKNGQNYNKYVYKGPPNMGSFDIPNGTFVNDPPEISGGMNDPMMAYNHGGFEESSGNNANGGF